MVNKIIKINYKSETSIEFLMIKANQDVGNHFYKQFKEKLIVRSHPVTEQLNLEETMSLKEMEDFMFRQGVIQQRLNLQDLIESEGIRRFYSE